MSDQPTSFHDFKWACGHVGPGYCKTCHTDEIERLEADLAYAKSWGHNQYDKLKDELERLRAALDDAMAHHERYHLDCEIKGHEQAAQEDE